MALDIGTKVENEGKNSQGRLSAAEFNQLIELVKVLEKNNVADLQKKLTIIDDTLNELKNSGSGSEAIAELRKLIDKVAEDALVIGTTEGTAYDGAMGATLEQLVRELAGGAGTMYSVYVRNNMPSLGFVAQYGEECVLDFTFVSQYRDDISEPYKPTGELGLCTVMVKNSKFTDFTVVKRMEISSNVSVKQDVSEWLTSGSNNIKVSVEGENTDKTTAPVTYIVQLTSLGISAPNFAWWMAFAGDIPIPMIINGNISKTLHIAVTGDNYNQGYTQNLGTAVYLDTPSDFFFHQTDDISVTLFLP